MFTGIDGESYDVVKIFAIIGFLTGVGLQIYVVGWKNQEFDILTFSTGIGALFIMVGGALKLKETTEPPINREEKGNDNGKGNENGKRNENDK